MPKGIYKRTKDMKTGKFKDGSIRFNKIKDIIKYCKCNCGNMIKIQKHHIRYGLPEYIHGHNKGMLNKNHFLGTRLKISLHNARKGKPGTMLGKKHTEEAIMKIKESRKTRIIPKTETYIEKKIQGFLKQLRIEYFTHQYMNIEHGYQCDILIPSKNLVIECDGNYWHCYPTGREIDHVRTFELIQKGFKVLRLWEIEINSMDINKFKEKLDGYVS